MESFNVHTGQKLNTSKAFTTVNEPSMTWLRTKMSTLSQVGVEMWIGVAN